MFRRGSLWRVVLIGGFMELALLLFVVSGVQDHWPQPVPMVLVVYVLYAGALYFVLKDCGGEDCKKTWMAVFVFALLFRLTVSFTQPVLSWDVYRYYWDGKVINNGINPYLYPPDDQRLADLVDTNWEKLSHKDLWTGYPPLAVAVSGVLYAFSPSIEPFRARQASRSSSAVNPTGSMVSSRRSCLACSLVKPGSR